MKIITKLRKKIRLPFRKLRTDSGRPEADTATQALGTAGAIDLNVRPLFTPEQCRVLKCEMLGLRFSFAGPS